MGHAGGVKWASLQYLLVHTRAGAGNGLGQSYKMLMHEDFLGMATESTFRGGSPMVFDIDKQNVFLSYIGLEHIEIAIFREQNSWIFGLTSASRLHNLTACTAESYVNKP